MRFREFFLMLVTLYQLLSVVMNMLLTKVTFGVKRFKHFRKQLILDYKKGKRHQHTNPHAMPNELKQKLLNEQKGGNWKKIRQIERQSLTPFGRFTKHGFIFQKDKLPVYDIPNIDGFELLPYVQYLAPKLDNKLIDHQQRVNRELLQKMNAPKIEQSSDSKTEKQ